MLNFNTSPYFDDFDRDKKFYRILYRPSYAVQGRELTQSQSLLQDQISKFANHIFEEGAMVIPGQITFDNEISYQKMESTYGSVPNVINIDPVNFLGYTIVGESSGVEGDIINIAPADSTDPLTFMIKFKSSGNDKTSISFWDGETVYRKDDPQIRAKVQGTLNIITPTFDSSGKGSITSIDKGVYYFNGMFIDNDAQSIIVDKYSQFPTCKVGLRVYETIVTPEDDISLTDNAKGSPNYAAPGAHRYKIELKLEHLDYDADVSNDFIVLQYLKNGTVEKEIRTSDYSELEKTFARRTFDESGDYTVNPFSIIMKEHFRDENDEKYKEGVYFPPIGDKNKLIAEMGIGKAYVQGYEITKISTSNIEIDKARDFDIANNAVTNFSLGNYVRVNDVWNIPRIDEFGEIKLYGSVATHGTHNNDLVGNARVRAIKRFGSESYLYIFDIDMLDGYNFEDHVRWIYDSNGNGINNFTCSPIVEDNKVILYKTENNELIFPLPNSPIKTLSVGGAGIDTNYNSTRAYFNAGIVGGVCTLVAKDNEVFQQDTNSYYISDAGTGAIIANATFNFTGTPTGKVLEIGNLSGPVNVIAPIAKNISTQKTKNIQTDESIIIASPNKKQNGKDYLNKADIIRIKNIYMSNNTTTTPTTSDIDVTNRYTLDNGQRDNYYDVGSIILNAGEPAPKGQLLIIFDYYTHTEGDYFTVDSYVDNIYDDYPFYYSKESGETYQLFDCFDFRPRMADDRSGFVNTGASIGELPQVFSDIRSDYEYYLNRIDYLYLDFRGSFKVARGIPAIHPKPPEKPETGMVLYEIKIPAYTFSPEDVNPIYKDNKRYTMRDIGDLDRRIGNLEYYTSLSLLERETASMEILDENGLNRFKNGFIVDPFDSHGVGDATHSDYNCAIDPDEKILRPKFNDENIGLLFNSAESSHVQRTGGVVTLPYTHVGINKQIQASKYENINPFAFRNIFAKITFNPDSDIWHDKKKLPRLVVNNSPNYEALKFIADNTKDLNGIVWGKWNDVGGKKLLKTSTSRKVERITKDPNWKPHHHRYRSLKIQTTTTTTSTYSQRQQRSGGIINHRDSNVISKSLGDRITDINYIPYMRSIPVIIKSDQLKKNTKVYPFFDNISMSKHCEPPSVHDYCTPASKIYFSSISGEFHTVDRDEEILRFNTATQGTGIKVLFQTEKYLVVIGLTSATMVNPNDILVGMKSGAQITVDSVDYKVLGDELITGEYGEIALVWNIPNDESLKFMTGEREFVLTDQITNDDPVHTKASGMFKSHGLGSKQQDTVLSTKTITFGKTNVRQNRIIQKTSSNIKVHDTGWIDPLAQSFLINESGGCFLTKVRVWFQSKDTEESVICQIRNMVNGYPAEIFMATTALQPKDVKVSEREPGEPTEFIFSEPVYLQEGESYCFVLMPASSSASYQVWVAETGKTDIKTGEIITGKESLGSMFKSQNASTWTPNQNEDIMFSLFKAKFDIGTSGKCILVNSTIKEEKLQQNPIETQKGSDRVRVYIKDHALPNGSILHLSGFDNGTSYNGFLGSQLNGDHVITDREIDSVVFEVSGIFATDEGMCGGQDVMATRNYQLDVARPIVNELLVDDTSIDWSMKTITNQSIDGSQTPYTVKDYIDCINNEDIDMSAPMIIASKYNEDNFLNGDKSFKMQGIIKSNNENVSPVVDAAIFDPHSNTDDIHSTSTLIAIGNRIDFPTTTQMPVTSSIFSVGAGEDELNIHHPNHEMSTGSMIYINNFTDTIPGVSEFNPNGLHEIRVIDNDNYLIDMDESTSIGYSGDGGGNTTISYSTSHHKYVPEEHSFGCSTASRYFTKQATLKDPAENFKLFFSAVREQESDIDVYYKVRSPYEVTEWNELKWIRLDTPDEVVAISQSNNDFKDYSFTVENIDPYNSISIKLVMKSTDSTQVPIFKDLRLICTT